MLKGFGDLFALHILFLCTLCVRIFVFLILSLLFVIYAKLLIINTGNPKMQMLQLFSLKINKYNYDTYIYC